MARDREGAVLGCLLGTALGDALGLWCEGLSPRRQRRLHPDTDRYHFFFGRGMVSDDTEHACMVAQALIVSAGDVPRFLRSLAWRLRFWLLGLPAGIGRATLRATVKLWLGFPPHRSGVFSAGNGPAMRSPLLGVCYGHDPEKLRALVRASTRLTHTDPKAEFGAFAVALAAHLAGVSTADAPLGEPFLQTLSGALGPEARAFLDLADRAVRQAAAGQSTADFAADLGLDRGGDGLRIPHRAGGPARLVAAPP
jgi:ADP-ribosyl-[dinitrogen reductase] hydrolase